jgi:hypothetical protein
MKTLACAQFVTILQEVVYMRIRKEGFASAGEACSLQIGTSLKVNLRNVSHQSCM